MRRVAILVLVLSLSLCAVAKSSGSHSSHGSRSHSSKSRASKKSSSHSSHGHAYRKNYAAAGYSLHSSVQRDSHGRIKRGGAAKDAFKRQRPCASTGKRSAPVPATSSTTSGRWGAVARTPPPTCNGKRSLPGKRRIGRRGIADNCASAPPRHNVFDMMIPWHSAPPLSGRDGWNSSVPVSVYPSLR